MEAKYVSFNGLKKCDYFDAIITSCNSNQTGYIFNSVTSSHYSCEIQAIMRNYQIYSIYFVLCIVGLLPQDVHALDMSAGVFFGVFFGSFIALVALIILITYLCKRAGCDCDGGGGGGDTYTFSQGIPLS